MRNIPIHILRMAEIWYKFESESCYPDAPPPRSKITLSDMLAIAVPRVEAVIRGDVRWSEASPGDRGIWIGRPRAVEEVDRDLRSPGHLQTYWENLWDTITLASHGRWSPVTKAPIGTWNLFGNENVGDWHKSNLQSAGGCHAHWEIAQMYADCERPLEPQESVVATLIVGLKHVAQRTLSDLMVGCPVGYPVLPRQCFQVAICWRNIERPIWIRVHLEGRSVRTDG